MDSITELPSQEEIEACMIDTNKHRRMVKKIGRRFISLLHYRLFKHDKSKLESPEIEGFAKFGSMLSKLEYGSDEYKESLEKMKPFLKHHYKMNSHHPEHYPNGINDMDLYDIIEMMADWKASCLRTKDGDFQKSMEINIKRFNIESPLKEIMMRSVRYFYPFYIEITDKNNEILYSKGFETLDEIGKEANTITEGTTNPETSKYVDDMVSYCYGSIYTQCEENKIKKEMGQYSFYNNKSFNYDYGLRSYNAYYHMSNVFEGVM